MEHLSRLFQALHFVQGDFFNDPGIYWKNVWRFGIFLRARRPVLSGFANEGRALCIRAGLKPLAEGVFNGSNPIFGRVGRAPTHPAFLPGAEFLSGIKDETGRSGTIDHPCLPAQP
jgi:hypothetical protein